MKKIICIILTISILLSISVFAFASSSQYGCFKLTNLAGTSNDSSFNTSALSTIIGNVTGQYKYSVDYYQNPHEGNYVSPRLRMRYDARSFIGPGDFNTAMYLDASDIITDFSAALNSTRWSSTGSFTNDTSNLKFQLSIVSNIPLLAVAFHIYNGTTKLGDVNYGISEIAQKNGMLYTISCNLNQYTNVTRIYCDLYGYAKFSASGTKYWDVDYWDISIGKTLVPFWQPKTGTQINNVVSTYSDDMSGLVSATNTILDYLEEVMQNQEMSIGEYQHIQTLLNMIIGNLEIIH